MKDEVDEDGGFAYLKTIDGDEDDDGGDDDGMLLSLGGDELYIPITFLCFLFLCLVRVRVRVRVVS